ncbi:MAG: hypothetical protein J0L60_06700 [Ignavibacteria bacterium]|nr:hypothetical protein [Ignavibacteria bacterium]
MKTINYFNYEKELTNEDIIRYAKIIAQASKEISEIEEAKKRLRDLKETIERHSKYIQEGKIVSLYQGEFEWHKPVQNCVTISSPTGRFPAFLRDMTPEEIKEHSQLEIPFDNTVEQVTDMIVEAAKEAGFDTVMKDEKTNSEDEDDIFLDNAGEEEFTKQGDYYIKGPQGFHSPMVWDVLRHDGHGRMPDHIGTFYSHSDAKRKVRELRKEAEAQKERIRTDQIPVYKSEKDGSYFLLDNEGNRLPLEVLIDADKTITFIDPFDKGQFLVKSPEDIQLRDEEPEQLSKVKVWKALNGGYFVFNEQQDPVPLKVLNSLENVVFLEQEGVEGVILKRHSEIIPSGIYL